MCLRRRIRKTRFFYSYDSNPKFKLLRRRERKKQKLKFRWFNLKPCLKNPRWWFNFLLRRVVLAIGGLIAAFSSLWGVYEVWMWYDDKCEIERMANRYAAVGKSIYYQENNPDIALKFIHKAIEIDDGKPEFRYQKAYMTGMSAVRNLLNLDRPMTKSELNSAHSALAEALFLRELAPARPESYILEGQIFTALKEYDRAECSLKKALKLDPKNAFSYVRLGTLYLEKNKPDDAIKMFDQAWRFDCGSKWACLWKGIAWSQKEEMEKAKECYERALMIDPKFDLAYYNLGWAYLSGRNKDYKEAKRHFSMALQLNPDYKEASYAMGMTYAYQNDYELAKVYLGKAIKLDERYLTGYKWRGIVNGEMKKNQEAVLDFNKAIELDPQNPDLRIRRAKILCESGRLDDAVSDLRFALSIKPDDSRIYLYLGNVYAKTKDKKKALRHYDKALELSPDYAEALAEKATLCWTCYKDYKTALDLLDKASSVAQYKPERFWLMKGKIFSERKEWRKAQEYYRRTRCSDSHIADAWLGEANSLHMLNKNKEALVAINKYLNIRPEDHNAIQLKEKCECACEPIVF